MALGKMFNLGGIDNRPPKVDQELGGFRVARNVQPTPDNRLIPRYDNRVYTSDSPAFENVCMHKYGESFLSLRYANDSLGNIRYTLLNGASLVPSSVKTTPLSMYGNPFSNSQSVSSFRRKNTVFFQCPIEGYLLKYDGVELRKSGCAQPIIGATVPIPAGTKYVRAVQHTIDFDLNEPWSNFVPFRTSAVSLTLNTGTAAAVPNILALNNLEIVPTNDLEESYFIGTAATASGNTLQITTSSTNITTSHPYRIGSYIFVNAKGLDTTLTGLSYNVRGVALKINSILVGAPDKIVLDCNDAYVMNLSGVWLKANVTNTLIAPEVTFGTKTFISFWEALTEQGIYYYRDLYPSFPVSGVSYPITFTLTAAAIATAGSDTGLFTLGPQLNAIYDHFTVKLDPNSDYDFGGGKTDYAFGSPTRRFYNMTSYQDILLLANDDIIWISDSSQGGDFEQLDGTVAVKIGSKQFGRITAICATQDFLFVSRERKNYYVLGNISTGNYKVQEISQTDVGAWSNSSAINIKDMVIFLSSIGIFSVSAGGNAELLSKKLPKNFATYDAYSVNEDVVFRMTGTTSSLDSSLAATSHIDDNGLCVAYDEYRNFLIFCKKGVYQNGSALVVDTRSGETYEWDGILIGGNISSLMFQNAKLYVGNSLFNATTTPASSESAVVYIEDSSASRNFLPTNPAKLFSNWLTAGEPSLEKTLLQLKMFGRFQGSGANGLKITSFKDWDFVTKITSATYIPISTAAINSQTQYSHKKRLNSDKVLAASVGFEMDSSSVDFELEALEIEFNPIQVGMKK